MSLSSEALRRLKHEIGSRIGVLGGTFDPVHNGHLAAAEAVRHGLALDAVLFIPAARPPHKKDYPLSSFTDRLAMLELALAGRPEFLVARIEAERSGPSYSVDTLRQLHELWDQEKRLFFILGLDAFMEIAGWKEFSELPRLAELVVLDRPGHRSERLGETIASFFPLYRLDSRQACWINPESGGRIRPFPLEPMAVSSTRVRQAAGRLEEVVAQVPLAVARYIREHHLYEGREGAAPQIGDHDQRGEI
jgi:nicotinate-nucleotide adenylyltransferase